VDASREATEDALARAHEEGVSIQTRVEDLGKIPYIDEEAYDLVICFNYLQRSLMPQMKNWVKPGGMLEEINPFWHYLPRFYVFSNSFRFILRNFIAAKVFAP